MTETNIGVLFETIRRLEKENEQLKTELKAIREERHKEFIIGNGR